MQPCHRTLKTTSTRTAKTLVLLPKETTWVGQGAPLLPTKEWAARFLEKRIYTYSPMVSSCFRGEVKIDFPSLPVKCSTCWSSTYLDFPPSFSEPKKTKTLSEGLRLLGTCPLGWNSPRLCDLALLGRGNFQSWSSFRWGDGLYIYKIYNFYIFKMVDSNIVHTVHR